MTKVFYKKENIFIWYLLLILCVGIIIFGYVLIYYFVWQIIPLIIAVGVKILNLSKNNVSPTIQLDDNGLTTVNIKLGNQFYSYEDISFIKINSKILNGYLKLKSKKNKITLDTVAIDLVDQEEIVTFVKNKIA